MSVELLLKNGIAIVDGREVVRSIAARNSKIFGIYLAGEEPPAEEIIDCSGLYILPGAIDMHVHLRDLKESSKEDYASGTKAAASGGVTTVVDMPNSNPPVLDSMVLDEKIKSAKTKRFVNIGFYAGIPRETSDFDHHMTSHILGLKVYPHSPLAEHTKYTAKRIQACLKIAANNNLPLLFHPDSSKKTAKPKTLKEFFSLHSCESETKALMDFIRARNEVGGRLHVCHVSCASTAHMISENRAEDSLTAEVTPHHLLLSADQFSHETGAAKMLPPLRSPYDNQILWQQLCSRCAIDCVASDHAPHLLDEKTKDFLRASSGIPGLETTVPLMLSEVFRGKMPWVDYLRACCSGPAAILGLQGKGVLSKGYDADIAVIRKESYEIKGESFNSKAKMTPFEGRKVLARPIYTIVQGEVVYAEGKFLVGAGIVGQVPVRKH